MRLRIEAAHCPEVLPRALGLIAWEALVPASISFERAKDKLLLDIHLDELGSRAGQILLRRVENIMSVRSAELVDAPGMPILGE